MTKNEGSFPIYWKPMHGMEIVLTESDIQACFGLERIVLRKMADQERLYPIIGSDQSLEASTWAARRMAHSKGMDKPFILNQAAGDDLLNRLAGIKGMALVGFSEEDHSYVIWPGQDDVIQTSDFYG